MKNPNNDIIRTAAILRTTGHATIDSIEHDYVLTVNDLSNVINDVIFDSLKQGRRTEDILRALNELGNVLVSQTKDYDEFKEW